MPPKAASLRVVVFGGTGFIGRACVEGLRAAGHKVVAASRSSSELRCDLCNDSAESLVRRVGAGLPPRVVARPAVTAH